MLLLWLLPSTLLVPPCPRWSAGPGPSDDPWPPLPPVVAPAAPPAPAASVPLGWREQARYDVRFGPLGSVGALTLSTKQGDAKTPVMSVHAEAEGAVLGLGRLQRRLDAEFDLAALRSRRWTEARVKGGETIVDVAERQATGAFGLERRRGAEPPARLTATFDVPTSDAAGLVLRLRLRPPAPGQPETLQLLDGRALYRVRVWTAVEREPVPGQDRFGLRLDGEVTPVGDGDGEEKLRRFKLWLAEDPTRLPLRLEISLGISTLQIVLEELRKT